MRERENDDRLSVLWRAKWWLLAIALIAGKGRVRHQPLRYQPDLQLVG